MFLPDFARTPNGVRDAVAGRVFGCVVGRVI